MTDTQLEIVWAAGFFDGEGHVSWQKTALILRIGQVRREPLDRFRAAMQMGKVYGPYGPYPNTSYSTRHFAYQPNTREVPLVIEKLWPFLCEPKREQILNAKSHKPRTFRDPELLALVSLIAGPR